MTVTAAEARIEYAGNGATKVFAYPYQFFQADDLDVWLFNDATGEGVEQILGSDYTVTGELNPTGGNVAFTVAPPAGYTVIIINNPDIVQTLHYVNADDFPADSHEQGLDRLTKICQRLSDRVDRAVRAPDYAPEDQVPDAGSLLSLVEDAQEAADESAVSAAAAASSADSADTSEANAASAADTATTQAGYAAASASNALNFASAASASANDAADSAAQANVDKIEWQGLWSAATQYAANDAVSLAGTSYIAKVANMNNSPDTHPTLWDVLAAKGAAGPAGSGSGDMLRANNLNDVASISTSRNNLGLKGAAILDVGTTAGTVAAGDDARINGAVQHTGDTMVGHLGLPTGPAATQAVRKDYVDAAVAAVPAPPVAATAAEYVANSAPTKMLTPGAVWAAAAVRSDLSGSGPYTPDFSAALHFFIPVNNAAATLNNPTGAKAGQKGLIYLQQIGGSSQITSWGSMYKFPGGVKPPLISTPSAIDVISFSVMDGATILCSYSADFK
jgi:hypothetical protein